MSLARVLRMSLPEIVGRSRRQSHIWLERTGVLDQRRGRSPKLLARDGFFAVASSRFFPGVTEPPPVQLGDVRQTILEADRLCARRFTLLGHREVSFGDPIDWHLDPISGRRSSLVHWSRLDPLDHQMVGDSKIVWELNRHQWLLHLGQAYRFTGDERYAATFASAVRTWVDANPPGAGINWASSLEVALRVVAWCWALFLFRGSQALTEDLFEDLLREMETHATYVERHLSHYFSPNTHLTGEALGLFYAGVVCAELEHAARWRAIGARILVEQIKRQAFADGVYFEQSTYYQRYTVDIYLHFLLLAGRNQIAIPPFVAQRVQQMLDFLLAVRHPDGSMPQIGDADGGRILPLVRRTPDDTRDLFSTAAAFFHRADYAWAAGQPALETSWLLGQSGVTALNALTSAAPATASARAFPDGGYVIMRSGWDAEAHEVIFDVGPLGCPYSSGHGHADLLSVQCCAFGTPYLVDAGTYGYTRDATWRDFFRSTAAHSTVFVDGIGQATPAKPFSWKTRPRAWLRRCVSTEAYDLADADHDGYRELPDPVVHRRRVLFVKPRYWVIVDDLAGRAEHHVELRFQCAASIHAAFDETPWVRARGPNGHALLVGAFTTVPLAIRIVTGQLAPIEGWISRDYGQREPAPMVVYAASTSLPLRILSLIVPIEDASAGLPRVSFVQTDAGSSELLIADSAERVSVTETTVSVATVDQ
jgi:uncharacterized heparinase superfamily protein